MKGDPNGQNLVAMGVAMLLLEAFLKGLYFSCPRYRWERLQSWKRRENKWLHSPWRKTEKIRTNGADNFSGIWFHIIAWISPKATTSLFYVIIYE